MKIRSLKLVLLATTLFSSATLLKAETKDQMFNPLLTAVPSLVIAPDARGGGLGDVGAATSADINSQYWNPAKYAQMESRGGFSMSYTPWLRKIVNDIDLVYLAGYYKLDERQALASSFRYFSLGQIDLTEYPAGGSAPIEIGTAKPYELAVDVSYSRSLSEHWSAAVALRFIYSDLTNGMGTNDAERYSAGTAMGADVAAYYSMPVNVGGAKDGQISFGVNASNIGTKISYDKGITQQFIPTNLRLGGAFEYPFDEFNSLTLAVDLNKLLVPTPPKAWQAGMSDEEKAAYEKAWEDYRNISSIGGIFKSFGDAPGGFKEELEEIMWSVGLEYAYNKQFLVRGGYFHESQDKGNRKYFALGVGFNLSIFQLNAAYLLSTAQTNPLDQTLRFTLGFDLAGIKDLLKNE